MTRKSVFILASVLILSFFVAQIVAICTSTPPRVTVPIERMHYQPIQIPPCDIISAPCKHL